MDDQTFEFQLQYLIEFSRLMRENLDELDKKLISFHKNYQTNNEVKFTSDYVNTIIRSILAEAKPLSDKGSWYIDGYKQAKLDILNKLDSLFPREG